MTTQQRRVLATILAGAAVAAAATGAHVVCAGGVCTVPAVDAAGLAALRRWQGPALDVAFGVATWAGSIGTLLPAALLVAWRSRLALPRIAALFVPVALLGATLLAHSAKLLVARPRPDAEFALVAMPVDASFPSAHTMQAVAFALALLMRPGFRPGWKAIIGAAAFIALIGLSRVYLQVHFPTDVLFGVLIAALWVAALRCLPGWAPSQR